MAVGYLPPSHFINYVVLFRAEWRKGCRWWWLERRRRWWEFENPCLVPELAVGWVPTTFVCTLMDSFLPYLHFFLVLLV